MPVAACALRLNTVTEGASSPELPNDCVTCAGQPTQGPLLAPDPGHQSNDGGIWRENNGRSAGNETQQRDGREISASGLGNIFARPQPFLSLSLTEQIKEEDEEEEGNEDDEEEGGEEEEEEEEEEDGDGEEENTPYGQDEGRGEDRDVARRKTDIIPSEDQCSERPPQTETAIHPVRPRSTVSVGETRDEWQAAQRSDQQEPEEEEEDGEEEEKEEEDEQRRGQHGQERHDACVVYREVKDVDSSIPGDDTARGHTLMLAGVQTERSGSREGQGEERYTSCTGTGREQTKDENAPQGYQEVNKEVGSKGQGIQVPRTGAATERKADAGEDEEMDSSYRRDCAVLAGTAKIVFALLALEHRRVSTRFYRWKRTRP